MGRLANTLSIELFGLDTFWLWLTLTAVVCTALAIGGPAVVVRRFLERFGTWIVLGAAFSRSRCSSPGRRHPRGVEMAKEVSFCSSR